MYITEKEYKRMSEANMISLTELNRLKSFRYGYFGFYPLAVLVLIYSLFKNLEAAGLLSIICAYSTAVYYFRYKTSRDVMSVIIVLCGIIGTITSLAGFVIRTW